MRSKLVKDLKQRKTYSQSELQQLRRKLIENNLILSEDIRRAAHKKYVKEQKQKQSLTLIRNRCLTTGRSRGIIKEYAISRIIFRQLAEQGRIPGLRRAC